MLGARRFRSEGRRGEEGCLERGKAEMLCLVWRREEKKSLFFYKAFLPCSLGIAFLLWVISPASLAGTAGAVSIGRSGQEQREHGSKRKLLRGSSVQGAGCSPSLGAAGVERDAKSRNSMDLYNH